MINSSSTNLKLTKYMKVNVQTPNFAADDKLLVFIEKKISKLDQFYDRIICADVFLKVQRTSEKERD